MHQPQYQSQEKQQHACRTEETFLLAYRTEDKVCILLRHELQLGLRSIEETFSLKSAGTNGNLTLMHVISRTSQIFIQSQQHVDTHSLMRFHHMIQHIIGRIEESDTSQRKDGDEEVIPEPGSQSLINQESDEHSTQEELDPHNVERNDIGRKEHEEQRNAYRIGKDHQCLFPIARIGVHHASRKNLHQQKHDKLTHRSIGIPHHHVLILHTHYEVSHHRHAGKENGTRHSFAVKHEEE